MDPAIAHAYYRKNYLFGVARPGAIVFDGTSLSLYDNGVAQVWSAPLSAVQVKKGAGTLTVSINGIKASILTAVGGTISPAPSPQLKALLAGQQGIPGAPTVDKAYRASEANVFGSGVYAKGQKALREFFGTLGVLH